MKKLLIPALAGVLVVAVGFVLVELHAPLSPADARTPSRDVRTTDAPPPAAPPGTLPPGPPSAHSGAFANPGDPPLANGPPRPEHPPAIPPLPSAPPGRTDPGDVVIEGKTRREWHAYYAERQRQMTIEILKYQTVIDRAIAGEEPDPKELGEAHDHVAELKGRMNEDIAALQRIDATP